MQNKVKTISVSIIVLGFSVVLTSYLYTDRISRQIVQEGVISVQEEDLEQKHLTPSQEEKTLILNGEEGSTELIEKYAQDSHNLIINEECDMQPLVIRFKGEEKLTIKNQDSAMHTVAFENQNFFTVSPGSEREIQVARLFSLGQGKIKYKCLDVSKEDNVGVMYIVSQ